ncbi:UDP-N-acetylmuramate--L-alanine ligase [Prolixibacter denitrificans]|uniref:Peptidoglycan synthetase n=1 Tax=Prolixibacter denitrificans TaxID=1541063 RepID=A0A2P8CKZ7_9BACT|nr:Mur ligase family protein [Prolixibacter denitrificans]PSK85639.1 UDP-N-acetylmuramate: L-alanyl-gamma-D-glutamyl-meso-diaminopimelate ligase [Prolixibacter denitrificans]GET20259.1 peptidoglycan synthetase [Prolixibacter denitrificans]
MNIHFIAIGGAAMHNLAITLKQKGYRVTGSDDEIFEPSKSRLEQHGLLPDSFGWDVNRITSDLDAVILGMHAREDNPELAKAKELGVKIYSYPEFLYEQTKNKTRVVIGGSHGKTTITSMIMHVLKENNVDFDYMVGAQIEGFDTMVRLSESAKIAVFEGDEYLSSPIDRRPKFHLYQPQIGLLSGIAWDHINVFPTFDNYVEQFREFARLMPDNGHLIYFDGDENLRKIADENASRLKITGYNEHAADVKNGETQLITTEGKHVGLTVFGRHNLQNISGAYIICQQLGVSDEDFYRTISTFSGAARRLERLAETNSMTIFRDFAHSPSKLKATVEAVKQQFPDRKLTAVMELHTFSSLKKEFLPLYKESMEKADEAFVYFSPHTIEHKKLEPITTDQVREAFGRDDLQVFTDSAALFSVLESLPHNHHNLLLMSSGTFSGKDLPGFAQSLTEE